MKYNQNITTRIELKIKVILQGKRAYRRATSGLRIKISDQSKTKFITSSPSIIIGNKCHASVKRITLIIAFKNLPFFYPSYDR